MAVPKKRQSKARGAKRRSHHLQTLVKLIPSLSKCPQCGKMNIPHRECKCGYYAKHEQKQRSST